MIVSLEAEMERLDRTVGVLQLPPRLRSRELRAFFEERTGGRVHDAQIVKDHRTGLSKGIGYVEFEKLSSIPKALILTGTKIHGSPCIVQTTHAEKRLLAADPQLSGDDSMDQQGQGGDQQGSQSQGQSGGAGPVEVAPPRRIYVGSLHYTITDHDLRSIFDPFGRVEFVRVNRDPRTNESKGFAFLQFSKEDDARRAYEQMNGFELMGRKIRVGWVTEKQPQQQAGGDHQHSHYDRNEERLEDVEGMKGMNVSRMEMMKRLAREEDMIPVPSNGSAAAMTITTTLTPRTATGTNHIPVVRPPPQTTTMTTSTSPTLTSITPTPKTLVTRNCLLTNMFDPATETTVGWAKEIRQDVQEECSQFGRVLEVRVDRQHADGHVYVRFADGGDDTDTGDETAAAQQPAAASACQRAVQALNGRWFAKKQIHARHIADHVFDAAGDANGGAKANTANADAPRIQ